MRADGDMIRIECSPVIVDNVTCYGVINFSRGLSATPEKGDWSLVGGPLTIPLTCNEDKPETIILAVHELVGAQFIGAGGRCSLLLDGVPGRSLTGGYVVEAMLDLCQRLEDAALIGHGDMLNGKNFALSVLDSVGYGKLDLDQFTNIAKTAAGNGEVTHAFFWLTLTSLLEDVRHAMSGAFYHMDRMLELFGELNVNHPRPNQHKPVFEISHKSERTIALAHEFSSAVMSCCTTLDILYRLFIYLTRSGAFSPELPGPVHFPFPRSPQPRLVFRSGGKPLPDDMGADELPYAIPNLSDGAFLGLKGLRNDLAHNMAPEAISNRVLIGVGLPPVNGRMVQYVQYMSRDFDERGEAVKHPWLTRFYSKQIDAQHLLYGWIEETAQCVRDTLLWLAHRLQSQGNPGA